MRENGGVQNWAQLISWAAFTILGVTPKKNALSAQVNMFNSVRMVLSPFRWIRFIWLCLEFSGTSGQSFHSRFGWPKSKLCVTFLLLVAWTTSQQLCFSCRLSKKSWKSWMGHSTIWARIQTLKSFTLRIFPHQLPFCDYIWMKFFTFVFQKWNHLSSSSHEILRFICGNLELPWILEEKLKKIHIK